MAISAPTENLVGKNQASNLSPAHLGERKSPLPYGVGILGISILGETFGGFAFYYYIDILGLAMVSAALVRTIFTLWDVVDDPIMGLLSDRTRTRWGRRHPWLLISLPWMILVFAGLFSVPASFQTPSRLFYYMLVFMLLYETLATILWVNYSSLYPELFKTLLERARVAVFCQTGNILGVIVALVISPLLYQAIGFSKMAIIYALAAAALYLFSLHFNREGQAPRVSSPSVIWPALRGILADRVFWLYAGMMVLTIFSTGMSIFALPFYVKYVLQEGSETISLLSGLALLAALLGMPVWNRLIKTWPAERIYFVTAAASAAGMLGIGLSPSLPVATIFFIGFGGAVQGLNVLNIVIRAGLVSRNIDRTGIQNEGTYYGLLNSALRMVGVLQSLAMVLAWVFFGYVSGNQPGQHPDLAFRFLIGFLPVAGLGAAALFARKFFQAFSLSQAYYPTS